jgi:hypothetical protein
MVYDENKLKEPENGLLMDPSFISISPRLEANVPAAPQRLV